MLNYVQCGQELIVQLMLVCRVQIRATLVESLVLVRCVNQPYLFVSFFLVLSLFILNLLHVFAICSLRLKFIKQMFDLQLHEGVFDWMNKSHAKFHWVRNNNYFVQDFFSLDQP